MSTNEGTDNAKHAADSTGCRVYLPHTCTVGRWRCDSISSKAAIKITSLLAHTCVTHAVCRAWPTSYTELLTIPHSVCLRPLLLYNGYMYIMHTHRSVIRVTVIHVSVRGECTQEGHLRKQHSGTVLTLCRWEGHFS